MFVFSFPELFHVYTRFLAAFWGFLWPRCDRQWDVLKRGLLAGQEHSTLGFPKKRLGAKLNIQLVFVPKGFEEVESDATYSPSLAPLWTASKMFHKLCFSERTFKDLGFH